MEDWIIINCTGEPKIERDEQGIIVFDDKKDAEAYCMEHGITRYKLESVSDLYDEADDNDEEDEDGD